MVVASRAMLLRLVAALASLTGCTRTPPPPAQPAVVLVVLDTVRADHVSACGYGRPTTPVLEGLVAQGAALACDAHPTGTWTLPSHASLFTGLGVAEHGAHLVSGGTALLDGWTTVRTLDGAAPTLAEELGARGYRTVLVSGNPIVGPATGLSRGFGVEEVAATFQSQRFPGAVTQALARAVGEPDGRPLFLVLNLSHAHAPWARVAEGHPWLPAAAPIADHERLRSWVDPSPAERAQLATVYDQGVASADAALGDALGWLTAHGHLAQGHRLVVTADHGEILGEIGVVGHPSHVEDGNTVVPLLAQAVAADGTVTAPDLPRDPSIRVAHALARDGAPPAERPDAVTFGLPHPQLYGATGGRFGGRTRVALWRDGRKWVWEDGVTSSIDRSDPAERAAERLAPEATTARLLDAYGAAATLAATRAPTADDETLQQLRAAGYLE